MCSPLISNVFGAAAMQVRAASAADADKLRAFHAALSIRSRAQRYFSPLRELPHTLVSALVSGDPAHRFFVVQQPNSAAVVGLGQYAIDGPQRRCEVALVVADAWQRCGLGRRLLIHLLDDAEAAGLDEAQLETERSNHAMQALARRAGFAVCGHPGDATLLMARLPLNSGGALPRHGGQAGDRDLTASVSSWKSIRNRSGLAQDTQRAAA